MTLVQLPSGTIDLVEAGQGMAFLLQFNAECLDCLPYCQAACCKIRPAFSVELAADELDKYPHFTNPANPGKKFIACSGAKCVFLNDENRCSTQHDKPRGCTEYHCSPGGKGEGITNRGKGWMLLMTNGLLK